MSSAPPLNYDGIAGLEPRTRAVIGVLSIGLKRQVIQDWKRDHPGYRLPNLQPVMFRDPARYFIKVAKGQGPKGSSAMQRYRPMLEGFETFNLDADGNPAGQTTFYGYLPRGEVTEPRENFVAAPYFRRQRKAAKLGRMIQNPGDAWEKFKRVDDYRPPRDQHPPSGQAECRGNGEVATRWMPGENGRWSWQEIRCLNDDCPFSPVCKITSELEIYSQAKSCGETTLLRYENQSANTTAHIEGFLLRMKRDLETFGMDGELYGLPVRLQVEMNTKSAGTVRGKQLPDRRFPVTKIAEQQNVVVFRKGLADMLSAGGGRLALPEAQKISTTPEEESASLADFTPDPPGKPRFEVVPVDHSESGEVIDLEPEDPLGLAGCDGAQVEEKLKRAGVIDKISDDGIKKFRTRHAAVKNARKSAGIESTPMLSTICQKEGARLDQLTKSQAAAVWKRMDELEKAIVE